MAAAAANVLKGSGVGILLCSFYSTLGLRRIRMSFFASQSHYTTTATTCIHPKLPTSLDSLSLSLSLSTSTSIRRGRTFSPFCSGSTTAESGKKEEEERTSLVLKEAADLLDIRVGRILKAWRHKEADSLYVEEVDVGEPQPHSICCGVVNYIPLHLLQEARVVLLANLKPRNMRGVKSYGMLMAASDGSHSNVELLVPPEGSIPGDQIWFGSHNSISGQFFQAFYFKT